MMDRTRVQAEHGQGWWLIPTVLILVAILRSTALADECFFPLFGNPQFDAGERPWSVAVGDFDGDLDVDVATANNFSDDISVLLNKGDGSFEAADFYIVGSGPYAVAAGDLDADQDLDLVVVNNWDYTVSVLSNNGDGTFVHNGVYPVGIGPRSVVLGDLDGDLDLDMAVINIVDTVSVLFNNGDGSFAQQVVYDVGDQPESLAVGDLDGDMDLDLVVNNYSDHNISVLLNNGNGIFETGGIYNAPPIASAIALGDVDGDLDLDLAVASWISVAVLLNNGDGTFAAFVLYGAGYLPRAVAFSDLDNDLDLDLAVANQDSRDVSILLNNGDGTFAPEVRYGPMSTFRSVAAADVDGDLDADLVFADVLDKVSVLMNDGSGLFEQALQYETGDFPFTVATGDLDGDDDLDLVVANYNNDSISVLLNNGDGAFASEVSYGTGEGPRSLAIADLDADVDQDLVVGNCCGSGEKLAVLLNNGDGTFAPGVLYEAGSPGSIALSDLDRDMDVDLAVADTIGDNLSVLFNNGDGTFTPRVMYGVSNAPVSIIAGDLDSDLDSDLAVTHVVSDTVSLLFNQGNGTFSPAVTYEAGDQPYWIVVGDLDLDLDLDMAVANAGSDNVSVMLNNGNGTFAPQAFYSAGDHAQSVALGDLDGDMDPDLVVTNYLGDNVSILLNNGDATFATDVLYGAFAPWATAMGDFDGNLSPDLAVTDIFHDNISILLNLCPQNIPPLCDAGWGYADQCQGSETSLQLDGSGSSDPEEDELDFTWSSDCPGAVFDDPSSPTPLMTVDTSGVCPDGLSCEVMLTVDDGLTAVSCSALVEIADTLPPEIDVCPAETTVACDGEGNVAELEEWLGSFAASDVCAEVVLANDYDGLSMDCGPTGSAAVTFTATDECGFEASCESSFTIEDALAPTLTCPDDVTVMSGELTGPQVTGIADAEDDCDPRPAVEHNDQVIIPDCVADPVHYTIERAWTAVDDCGNESSCVQTITVERNPVTIIIKQGACPAPVNPNSHGVVPVVLAGDAGFEVEGVDLSTLQLARVDCVGVGTGPNNGPPGPPIVIADLNQPYDGGSPCLCDHEHSADGIADLSMKFKTDELVAALDLDSAVGILELALVGETNAGAGFIAGDCIVIVPPGTEPENLSVLSNVDGAFIELLPLDLYIDDDGFADFARAYYPGTTITATAPHVANGYSFLRWMVNDEPQPPGIRTINTTLTDDAQLRAIYKMKSVAQPTPNSSSNDAAE